MRAPGGRGDGEREPQERCGGDRPGPFGTAAEDLVEQGVAVQDVPEKPVSVDRGGSRGAPFGGVQGAAPQAQAEAEERDQRPDKGHGEPPPPPSTPSVSFRTTAVAVQAAPGSSARSVQAARVSMSRIGAGAVARPGSPATAGTRA